MSRHPERGAAALALVFALVITFIAAVGAIKVMVDVHASVQQARYGADMVALAAMGMSPLAGGNGTIDRSALDELASHLGATIVDIDTRGWPLEIRITLAQPPPDHLNGFWDGVQVVGAAEVIPNRSPTGSGEG